MFRATSNIMISNGDWRLIDTQDGSVTLYSDELKESYHSCFGAIGEAQHVFIANGLKFLEGRPNIKILEMGFGTGLNVLMTILNKSPDVNIEYTAIDNNPLTQDIVSKLNYPKVLDSDMAYSLLDKIHSTQWNEFQWITDNFKLCKERINFLDWNKKEVFDLIFYDAFAPRVVPDLWGEDAFIIISNMSRKGSVFVTYCAKGEVRRSLEHYGFRVDRLKGPLGKREMLRGIKG